MSKRLEKNKNIVYPDSDGEPMADNTEQFDWIVVIKLGLELAFENDPNVFVAGDLLWYPVEGDNKTRVAPDAMVIFGRPKGYRGSYMQWVEDGIAPQVVFEILSPGNRSKEMNEKLNFYNKYAVEEYYVIDPKKNVVNGWCRVGEDLIQNLSMNGWISPRLGIKFEINSEKKEIKLYQPDGTPFESYLEIAKLRDQEKQRADQEKQRADQEKQRADQEKQRADQEKQRANEAFVLLEQERKRIELLAEKLRAAGIDPDKP